MNGLFKMTLSVLWCCLIVGCHYDNVENDAYDKQLMDIEFGEIHRMGSSLFIAFKEYNNLSEGQIISFVNCLVQLEFKNHNRELSSVEVYDKWFHLDGGGGFNIFSKSRGRLQYRLHFNGLLNSSENYDMHLVTVKKADGTTIADFEKYIREDACVE